MCSEPSGYKESEINGMCGKCGEDTVDGDAYYKCHWSSAECDECNHAPCDGSC